MILYLDASAIVKQYTGERGSREVETVLSQAESIATALISRAEVAAALANAVRLKMLAADAGARATHVFRSDWLALVRVPITESLVARADTLAWEHGLRGSDAVHLATALSWREAMGGQVTLATFDRDLWLAARRAGLVAWPDDLPALLAQWQGNVEKEDIE